MEPSREAAPLESWLTRRRQECGLVYSRIPWAASREWRLLNGRLVHASRRFFSIAGVRAIHPYQRIECQPIIHQPEIGILGFLLARDAGGLKILIQAKSEPGNVGVVQLAPTVQATESNYLRVHGGEATPHLEHFLGGSSAVVADSLQSEQGMRFFGKYNRNMTVVAEGLVEPESRNLAWFDVGELLRLLDHDYCVNTDARSVLACSDWHLLAGERLPFSTGHGSNAFRERLAISFRGVPDGDMQNMTAALRSLGHFRAAAALNVEHIALDALAAHGWQMEGHEIVDRDRSRLRVAQYEVWAPEREVKHWDQPLVQSLDVGHAVLLCQVQQGVLRFLFAPSLEVGFVEKVQFGPSLLRETAVMEKRSGRMRQLWQMATGATDDQKRLSCLQSDEGGRFFHSITRYEIIEIPQDERLETASLGVWLSLAEVYVLLRIKGIFTNEARTLISMLLVYL